MERGRAAALLVCLALLASGCGPSHADPALTPDGSNGAVQPASVSPAYYRRTGPQGNGQSTGRIVRIGAALSLTGNAKLFGSAQRSGIKLAQDEINANHVLGSTRLEVIIEDDASDREQASAAFGRFIENSHVLAIMGPTLSDTALSVDPLAQQAGVPVLAISNAAGGITQIGNFIFRDCLSESQLTPQILKMVRQRLKIHNAALLYTDTDPNRAGSQGFKKALQDFGIHIASELVFTRDQTDFSPQLDEIAASRPDALFVTAPAASAAAILMQARQHGLSLAQIAATLRARGFTRDSASDAAAE